MSLLFWKHNDPSDSATKHEPARGVDEQHALPVDIFWRVAEGEDATAVSPAAPLPVATRQDMTVRVKGSTKQVSVGTTATKIADENPNRRQIKVTNVTGAQLIYLGFDDGVTSSRGDYLHSTAGSNTSINATDEVWGIAITAAQTVSVMEEEYV